MLEAIRPVTMNDTGRVPIVDTGEVRVVRITPPRILKFLVGLVAFLVALGAVALVENQHLDGWFHDGRSDVSRWVNDAKSAVGISSQPQPTASTHQVTTAHTPPARAARPRLVTYKKGTPTGLAETISVAAPSFTVKIIALKAPCWVEATTLGQPGPVFEQTLAANQDHVFTVTSSMTIETGSAAGRAFVYQGYKLIGFYFPSKTPFKMTFNAVN